MGGSREENEHEGYGGREGFSVRGTSLKGQAVLWTHLLLHTEEKQLATGRVLYLGRVQEEASALAEPLADTGRKLVRGKFPQLQQLKLEGKPVHSVRAQDVPSQAAVCTLGSSELLHNHTSTPPTPPHAFWRSVRILSDKRQERESFFYPTVTL